MVRQSSLARHAAPHDLHPAAVRGMTLVEVLIVVAIVALLVALLVPGLNAAREAARATQCRNNLKQLAIAMQSYGALLGSGGARFPPGSDIKFEPGSGFPWTELRPGRRGSFLSLMLPYMDQQALYDRCDPSVDNVMQSTLSDGRLVASISIPVFLCPSDPDRGPMDGNPWPERATSSPTSMKGRRPAASNYSISMGSQYFAGPFPGNAFGTGSIGHGDTEDGSRISGVAAHVNFGATVASIRDGTSNTLALGEIRPKCSWHAQDGWMHFNSLWNATSAPLNYPTCPNEPGYDAALCNNLWGGKWAVEQAFRSAHLGGAHFALADGAVVFLRDTIDHAGVYQRLGDRRDGQTVGSLE